MVSYCCRSKRSCLGHRSGLLLQLKVNQVDDFAVNHQYHHRLKGPPFLRKIDYTGGSQVEGVCSQQQMLARKNVLQASIYWLLGFKKKMATEFLFTLKLTTRFIVA